MVETVGWVPGPSEPYGRGTSTIIWSCVTTIVLCTWNLAFLPIPPEKMKSKWQRLFRKIAFTFLAFLAPEFICSAAMVERLEARRQLQRCYVFTEGERTDFTYQAAFFAQIGGFVIEWRDTASDVQHLCTDLPGLLFLKRHGYIDEIPAIESEDLEGRSKADPLLLFLTVGQICWFLAQAVARVAQGLELALLEVETCGFVILAVIAYGFRFGRPQDVTLPIVLPLLKPLDFSGVRLSDQHKLVGSPEALFTLLQDDGAPMPQFWCNDLGILDIALKSSSKSTLAMFNSLNLLALEICVFNAATAIFGAVHIGAWSSPFATTTERILWQVSSLILATAFPFCLLTGAIFSSWKIKRGIVSSLAFASLLLSSTWDWVFESKSAGSLGELFSESFAKAGGASTIKRVADGLFMCPTIILPAAYIVARLILLGLTVSAFRAEPVTVYSEISWSKYIPHIA